MGGGALIAARTPGRIVFLTRRYPPSIGGIQTFSRQLYEHLREQREVTLVASSRESVLHLTWFLPWAFLVCLAHLVRGRVDAVYFADGVVASLAPLLRVLTRARLVATVHGAEVVTPNPLLRSPIVGGLRCCHEVVPVSQNTAALAEEAGTPGALLRVVYSGIAPLVLPDEEDRAIRARFEREHQLDFRRDRVVMSVGRLIPRKGVVRFLQRGLPLMAEDIRLIIGGGGPDLEEVRRICEASTQADQVIVLGTVEERTLAMLRRHAQLFIVPNVETPGDVEGFGMSHLEAMYSGTPVVAFAVDALEESVRRGGYLVEPGDYPAFVAQIHAFFSLSEAERLAKCEEAREFVRSQFRWEAATRRYLEAFGSAGSSPPLPHT